MPTINLHFKYKYFCPKYKQTGPIIKVHIKLINLSYQILCYKNCFQKMFQCRQNLFIKIMSNQIFQSEIIKQFLEEGQNTTEQSYQSPQNHDLIKGASKTQTNPSTEDSKNICSCKIQRTNHLNLCNLNCFPKQMLLLLLFYCILAQGNSSLCLSSNLLNTNTESYNVCQFCFTDISEQKYFLKCQKKINCKRATIPIENISNTLPMSEQSCQSTTRSIFSFDQCESLCCGHFQVASKVDILDQSTQTLNQFCINESFQRKLSVIKTYLIIFLPFILCMIFIILECFCKMSSRNNNDTLAGTYGQSAQSFIKQADIHVSKLNIQEQGPYDMNLEENCTICLDEKCNVVTNCGHYYHSKCLREWLVKRPKCPVCMSRMYNPGKVYCKKCKVGCKFQVFKRDIINQEESKHIQILEELTCQKCKTVETRSEEQIKPKLQQVMNVHPVNLKQQSPNIGQPYLNKKPFKQISQSLPNQKLKRTHSHQIKPLSQIPKLPQLRGSVREYMDSFKKFRQSQKMQEKLKTQRQGFTQNGKNINNLKNQSAELKGSPSKLLYREEDELESDRPWRVSQKMENLGNFKEEDIKQAQLDRPSD